MDLVYAILIGALAGWITGQLTKGSGFGFLGNVVVGIVGALVGNFFLRALGFGHNGSLIPSLLTAVFGAIVLLAVLGAVFGKKRR